MLRRLQVDALTGAPGTTVIVQRASKRVCIKTQRRSSGLWKARFGAMGHPINFGISTAENDRVTEFVKLKLSSLSVSAVWTGPSYGREQLFAWSQHYFLDREGSRAPVVLSRSPSSHTGG